MRNWIDNIRVYLREQRQLKKALEELKDPNSLIHSLKESNSVFVHIPKTAGLSIVRAVYGENVKRGGHRRILFYQKLFRDFDDYFKFSVVRNPWDRLYSAYQFIQKGGINEHDQNAREMHLSEITSFEEFVMNWLNEEKVWTIIHFFPQHFFLTSKNQTLLVDYIMRFENMIEDVKILERRLNKKITIPHENKTTESKEYLNNYTEEMVAKVTKIYQKDIEMFKYSFRNENLESINC